MAKKHIVVTESQRELLTRHWSDYVRLEQGELPANTDARQQFLAVCRGECGARTEHECAYLVGRRLVACCELGEEEVVRREFCVPAWMMKSTVLRASSSNHRSFGEHAVDVDRFSSKRRYTKRYNW